MILDTPAIISALVARVEGADGAAVRAMLGSAQSVLHAAALTAPLPARPLLAWRAGAVVGASGEMRVTTGAWWVYDDPAYRYGRINALVPLLEALYIRQFAAGGQTEVSGLGPELEDTALGLVYRRVEIAHYRRG